MSKRPTTRKGREAKAEATQKLRDDRIARAKAAYAAGKTMAAWGEEEGMSRPGASQFLRRWLPSLREEWRDSAADRLLPHQYGKDAIVFILKLLLGADLGHWSQGEIARRVGISDAGIARWRNQFAPLGVEDALMDYLADDEAEARKIMRQYIAELRASGMAKDYRPGQFEVGDGSASRAALHRHQKRALPELEARGATTIESCCDVGPEMNPALTLA